MTAFSINLFSGMSPMVSPRILDATNGQKAVNCRLTSGSLCNLNAPLKIGNNLLQKAGTKLSIYRFGSELSDTQYWFHWTSVVDVVKGSIAGDTAEKTYFTGDGAPKYTYSPLAITGGGTEYPYGSYLLGVIKPDLITVNASVANRPITSITKTGGSTTVTVEFPTAHNLLDGTKISIFGASDPLYNGSHEVTVIDSTHASYTTTTEPAANASGTLSFHMGGALESRLYAVTYVDAQGAEGAPAILSGLIDAYSGQVVSFTGLPTAPIGNYNYIKKRIYRTADGSSQSSLRYVGEVAIATTTFTDNVLGTYLGENIPSLDYEIPPADMFGLTEMSNGMQAGISGYDVCLCVPYQPHAYPIKGRYSFGVKPIALGAFGNSLVVLGNGIPSVLSGTSHNQMSQELVQQGHPCLSARSVVEIAGGVMWASHEGLAFISNAGFDLATKGKFTAKEWAAYNPSSIHAYRWDNRYVGFYTSGSVQRGFIMDLSTMTFVELDFYATAGFTNKHDGSLYLAIGSDVYKFDAGTPLETTWRSKEFTSPRPINIGFAKVFAADYPVKFRLYADGKLKHTKTVENSEIFTLPSGYKSTQYSFEIVSRFEVLGAAIAEASHELKGLIE